MTDETTDPTATASDPVEPSSDPVEPSSDPVELRSDTDHAEIKTVELSSDPVELRPHTNDPGPEPVEPSSDRVGLSSDSDEAAVDPSGPAPSLFDSPMTEITLTYETACARIEEIIRRLDSGEAGLRETLELCQEGRRLVEFCAGELDAVGRGLEELKLDELVARLETGRATA